MKNIYVVLGMARGGTSAVARALAAVGVDLGDKLTVADKLWNPTGFWEDNDIVYKVNQRLFALLSEPWMSTRLIKPAVQRNTNLSALEEQAMHLLKNRMSHSDHWGFKDPRTAKLLLFWQQVFAKLNLTENYIIALRNPLSSARSYSHLSGERLESSLLFWLMHMVAAVEYTQGKQRVIVNYDTIMQQPEVQLERLAKQCGLEANPQEIAIYANEFINKKLLRHSSTEDELHSNAEIAAVPLCAQIYLLLARVARDELTFESDEFTTSWQAIMNEFNKQYPLYCYADAILQRTRLLQKKNHKILKSLPWKFAIPLRTLETVVRRTRSNNRERIVPAREGVAPAKAGNQSNTKNIYVVLGLPRSGTSAITRSLQALGIGLEGNLQPARDINPKGFWEDVDIMYGINRTVTHVNGDKVVTAERLQEDSAVGNRLREIHVTAEKLLLHRMGNSLEWGFKDVRTGGMLPFWQSVFTNLNLKENYIIALRHPLSRAHSNQQFNHHDIEIGLISWLDYLVRVVDQTTGKNRVMVSYELMLQQPEQQLEHMRSTLSITTPHDAAAIRLYADQFLDKTLRHYSFEQEDLSHLPVMNVAPLCMQVYELLLQCAAGEMSLNDEPFALAWQQIKLAYQHIAPMHHYLNVLLADEKNLQRQLKKIQKSLPWKLTYPLRIVDDFLRQRRTQKRERQRWSHST